MPAATPPEVLWTPSPRPQAGLRLLCFSYAGAGAGVFRGWDQALGDGVELSAVQLPGREWRRQEPPLTRMGALVAHLLPSVEDWLADPRPGVFFGYSMGAALAYSVADHLQAAGRPGPSALFVAACRAPQLLKSDLALHTLDDAAFLAAIRRFGGMPDAIFNDEAMLALVLPALRADFEVLGTYEWQDSPPLDCPLVAYGGTRDPHAARAGLAHWRACTSSAFLLRLFTGGHFFLNESRGALLRTLAADLATHGARATCAEGC